MERILRTEQQQRSTRTGLTEGATPSARGVASEPALSFRVLADALPEIVWIARPEAAAPDYFNRRWYAYTGLSVEVSRSQSWLDAVHPDDVEPFLLSWRDAATTGKPMESECRLRRGADGAYRWHLARASLLDTESAPGESAFWTGTFVDIHRQKRAEDDVRSAEEWRRRFLCDVLRAVTEDRLRLCHGSADLPARFEQCVASLPVSGVGQLSRLRSIVLEHSNAVGLPEDRGRDLVTAVSEAAMNALVHGGGGSAIVCSNDDAQTVQVWIEDSGRGIALDSLHRATLERGYTTAGSMGYGFYMMLQTCDRIYLMTGPQGTTVVLEQDATPAEDLLYPDRAILLPELTANS